VLHMSPLNDGNILRAAQLGTKTNQFNTTTRRYDQKGLRELVSLGSDVVVIGLEDRYSELENIGLLILKPSEVSADEGVVDNYLLSCRVLGRGIETAIVNWALLRAHSRNWLSLRGQIIATERNTPVRGVFDDAGFRLDDTSGDWIGPTSPAAVLPNWLKVVDKLIGNTSGGH